MVEGPLPKVDDKSVLQRESIRALAALLPTREFLFRDERIDDYGVDGSIELLLDGRATNLRAQVQLKARSNTVIKQDGSVSIPVPTSNLNYLLNGICPIYLLYRPENVEVRFAFARDEWRRIEEVSANWRQQETIKVNFRDVLDEAGLSAIRRRIAEDARLQRRINEQVRQPRGAGRILVDAATLEVLDSRELMQRLKEIGNTLTNSGFAKVVVERASSIPLSELDAEPEAALTVAYAHFHLAHYYDASAAIRRILLTDPKFDPHSRSLLDALFISTRRMLGELDEVGYERETAIWVAGAPPDLAIQQEIAEAWQEHSRWLSEFQTDGLVAARATLAEILDRGRKVQNPAIALRCELLELTLAELDITNQLLDAEALGGVIGSEGGDAHQARMGLRQAQDSAGAWLDSLKEFAERTALRAPQVHCEALLLRTHAVLMQAGHRHLAGLCGHGAPLTQSEIAAIFAGIAEVSHFAASLENTELELSARQFEAKALDLFGRKDEANLVAARALQVAELSGCAIHARQLRGFLEGTDRAEDRLAALRNLQTTSEDDQLRNASDAQLAWMAVLLAKAYQLPEGRTPNILLSLVGQRQLAIERQRWCEQIALAEFRDRSEIMMYADPPLLRVLCSRFGYASRADRGEIGHLVTSFRSEFCSKCSYRVPVGSV